MTENKVAKQDWDWSKIESKKIHLTNCGFKWSQSKDLRFKGNLQVFIEKDGPDHRLFRDSLYECWGKTYMETAQAVNRDDGPAVMKKPSETKIKEVDGAKWPSLSKLAGGASHVVSFNVKIPENNKAGNPYRENIPVYDLCDGQKPEPRFKKEKVLESGKKVSTYHPVSSGDRGEIMLIITYPKNKKSFAHREHYWKVDMIGVVENVFTGGSDPDDFKFGGVSDSLDGEIKDDEFAEKSK